MTVVGVARVYWVGYRGTKGSRLQFGLRNGDGSR